MYKKYASIFYIKKYPRVYLIKISTISQLYISRDLFGN